MIYTALKRSSAVFLQTLHAISAAAASGGGRRIAARAWSVGPATALQGVYRETHANHATLASFTVQGTAGGKTEPHYGNKNEGGGGGQRRDAIPTHCRIFSTPNKLFMPKIDRIARTKSSRRRNSCFVSFDHHALAPPHDACALRQRGVAPPRPRGQRIAAACDECGMLRGSGRKLHAM